MPEDVLWGVHIPQMCILLRDLKCWFTVKSGVREGGAAHLIAVAELHVDSGGRRRRVYACSDDG